jgi:hypothetical protein
MPKYLLQKAALPVVALLMLASGCQPSTPPAPVASSPAATAPAASATPPAVPTTPAASASPSPSVSPAATGTFTAQSLAGEYTLTVNDAAKKDMEKSGIKEFKGKIVLSADGTFEGQLVLAGTPPDAKDPTPKSSELKAKGEFKVEGNMVLLTTKSAMSDGKEEKASPNVDKYIISADGKELKPEAQAQSGISFVRK